MSLKIANLDHVWNTSPLLAEALESLRDGIDTLGQKINMNPQGSTIAPSPPSALNIVASNGITHVTLTDRNPRTRQVHYFVEYDTNANFSNAHTISLHIGRSARIPTFFGTTPFYVRAYAMYPDGGRSSILYHGTAQRPVAILDGAATAGPPLPTTPGSGTSITPGHGFGQDHFVSSPKTPGRAPKTY